MRLGSRLGEATTVTRVALAVFVALRALTIAVADLPTIMPDEYGSWAIATRLALGDGLVSMQDMPSYPLVPGARSLLVEGAVRLHGCRLMGIDFEDFARAAAEAAVSESPAAPPVFPRAAL